MSRLLPEPGSMRLHAKDGARGTEADRACLLVGLWRTLATGEGALVSHLPCATLTATDDRDNITL